MIHRIPYAVVQWILMASIKAPLALIGLPAVFLSVISDGKYRTPAMWKYWADAENTPKEWATSRWRIWWFWAVRNPVRGLVADPVTDYKQKGGIDESKPGFQWRYRWAGWMDSFRVVWGEPRPSKGKKEFYIGWKIGSPSPNKFTVQFRPF